MITIEITEEDLEFVNIYAEKQNIGGISRLSSNDLNKSSRLNFQKTGLFCEIAWYKYRYDSIDKLKLLLDEKFETLRPQRKGDGGQDDTITSNGSIRNVDVKGSHCEDENRIQYLNLIIPEREYHTKQIYVCAFTIGKARDNVEKVILAGWCASEDIKNRWGIDNAKFAVKTKDLRDMKEIEQYIK